MSTTPMTISEAAAAIRSGEITAVELTTTHLERIEAENERLGAFVTVMPETALAAAAAADDDLANGIDRGPLQGIPLAIKDIIATEGRQDDRQQPDPRPRLGRRHRRTRRGPAARGRCRDGRQVDDERVRLRHARCREAASSCRGTPGTSTTRPSGSSRGYGDRCRRRPRAWRAGHRHRRLRRGPAAVNGHTGLKVTFGRVPKNAVVPLGYSLDSIGPMARSAWDCALLLSVMAGYDAGDPDWPTEPSTTTSARLTGSVAGLRIGVPMTYFYDSRGLDAERDGGRARRRRGAPWPRGRRRRGGGAARRGGRRDASMMAMFGEAYAYHRNDLVADGATTAGSRAPGSRSARCSAPATSPRPSASRQVFRRNMAAIFRDVDVLITPSASARHQRAEE